MAFSGFRLPVMGVNLGTGGTDVQIGSLTPQDITTASLISPSISAAGVVRVDNTGNNNVLDDVTTAALDGGAGTNVFGGSGTMTAGDALYIRPYGNVTTNAYGRIYFNVSTAGVGTWTIRVQRFNNTTDAWETQTIVTDTTSAFTVAGLGYIEFTDTVLGLERLNTGQTKYNWTKIELLTVTAVTTAPMINRCLPYLDGLNTIDVTAAINSGGVTVPFILPHTTSYMLFAMTAPPIGLETTRPTVDSPSIVYTLEYYRASDTSWQPLTTVRDETNLLTVVSATELSIRWQKPTDWTSTTLTIFNQSTQTNTVITGHIMRFRPTAAPTTYHTAGTMDARYVGIAPAFGAGIPLKQETYEWATYHIRGTVSATPVALSVINLMTGVISNTSLTANFPDSILETGHKITFSPSFVAANNDELIFVQLSGGDISDVAFEMHWEDS